MADEVISVQFDRTRMTFRELQTFERIAGVPYASLANGAVPTAEMIVAMTYIALHRNDPSVTVDDVWDMDIAQVDILDPTEAAPTPLKPLDKPATKRAKAS